ncbi:MAG TPA: hypothetical protein VFN56_01360, partial [Candidatus Saccharimonadales bacterium]|nr:hypothetical protein [Candidatus Saccharimonadales bacterium]
IRTVLIHHFFAQETAVPDTAIRQAVAEILEVDRPRQWYWALMDYGTYLKRTTGSLNTLSKSYTLQSRFAGSKRQVRGMVIRQLAQRPATLQQLASHIDSPLLSEVLSALCREGLIHKTKVTYHL